MLFRGSPKRSVNFKKTLYGLKQSPRVWFGQFSEVVQEFGLKKGSCDHFAFYQQSKAGIILLVIYVDDIVTQGVTMQALQLLSPSSS